MSSPTSSSTPPPESSESPDKSPRVDIVGVGPAGLTASCQLAKYGASSTGLEADNQVGGISRTVERDGGYEILPDEDLLLRPRMRRIYYNDRFCDYRVKATKALRNLGLIEAVRCVLS